MKKLSLLLVFYLLSFSYAYAKPKFDITLPLKGETQASIRLQYDTLMAVIASASLFNTRCNSYSIVDTKLVHGIKDAKIKDNKYIEGYWEELWIMNRCSQQIAIPILFTLDGKGGTYYQINNPKIQVIKK